MLTVSGAGAQAKASLVFDGTDTALASWPDSTLTLEMGAPHTQNAATLTMDGVLVEKL